MVGDTVTVTPQTPQAPETALLDVRGLTTSFDTPHGTMRAVDDVSLRLERGEMLAVVGESGSGKSVLARSVMRLLPKRGARSTGQVLLDGTDLVPLGEKQMRGHWGPSMSMIFQDPMTALNPVMRVGDQIAEALRAHGHLRRAEQREAVLRLLREVGIPSPELRAGQYPHELSGGMRQRIVIAVALALDPALLLADEPTTALDVTIQAQVMTLLRREQVQRRMAMLLITHDLGVAAMYSQTVVVMYAGQVVESARTARLFAATRSPYTDGLRRSLPSLANPPHSRLQAIPGRPPNLARRVTGCRFAPRCSRAQAECLTEPVPLVAAPDDPGHIYRCRYPVGTPEGTDALRRNHEAGRTATGLPVTGELVGNAS